LGRGGYLVLPSRPIKERLPNGKPHRLHLNQTPLLPNEANVVGQSGSLELSDTDIARAQEIILPPKKLARADRSTRRTVLVGTARLAEKEAE
jgi:hypothetical protein